MTLFVNITIGIHDGRDDIFSFLVLTLAAARIAADNANCAQHVSAIIFMLAKLLEIYIYM